MKVQQYKKFIELIENGRSISDFYDSPISLIDFDTRKFIAINGATERLSARKSSDLEGIDVYDITLPEYYKQMDRLWSELKHYGIASPIVKENYRPDGKAYRLSVYSGLIEVLGRKIIVNSIFTPPDHN